MKIRLISDKKEKGRIILKKDLMEILACPMCKNPLLELIILEEKEKEVETGIIFCKECSRYYPIKHSIPIMLPDDLRKPDDDIRFIKKYQDTLPEIILQKGKPHSLHES